MLRLGLGLLAVLHLLWGIPAVAAPRWFFDHFPGFGHRWTAAYPPYNEHLMTDVGAAATAFGLMLAMAAFAAHRTTTTVVLSGVLIFSALHLAFHVARHGALHGADLAMSLASLAAGVLAPALLLVLNARRAAAGRE